MICRKVIIVCLVVIIMEYHTTKDKIEIVRLVLLESVIQFNHKHPYRQVTWSAMKYINKVFNETGCVAGIMDDVDFDNFGIFEQPSKLF